MMKNFAILALVVLISCVFAEDTVKWAGTTTSGPTWTVPYIDDDGTTGCTTDASTVAPYVNFTVTFATDGIREVAAMAEDDFKSDIRVYIYTGSSANTATPCTNLYTQGSIGKVLNTAGGGPVLDDVVFFTAGTYTFIVSSAETTSGLFAVNIIPSLAVGSTAGGAVWQPVYDDGAGGCITDSDSVSYATFTWTQATSGYFDLYAIFANTSLTGFDSYVTLYQGVPDAGGLAIDACNNTLTGATVISWNEEDSFGTYIPYQWLTANWNYTLVFSGDDGETAFYGIQVITTRIRFFQQTPFVQPDRASAEDSSEDGCASSTDYTAASWDTTFFTAAETTYLLDTAEPPAPFSYLDTYSFLYSGFNTAVPPTTCPLGESLVSYGDTGDVTPVFAITEIGANYTVVVSTYTGVLITNATNENYAYVLYLFTGTPIGTLPATTTAGATTATTAAATVAGATVAGATTATTAAGATAAKASTTTTTSSTSSAAKASSTSSSSSAAAASTSSTSNKPSTTSSASSVVASVLSFGAILFVLF